MLRPAILTLTYEATKPFYVDCLANLLATWTARRHSAPPYRLVKGGDPAFQFYVAVREMLKDGLDETTDGVLSIEHDHAFRIEDAEKLLRLAEDATGSIVGGLYYQRMTDALVGTFSKEQDLSIAPLYSCTHVGLGFCWIPWSVFERIPEPWFDPKWHRNTQDGTWKRDSHDTAFCRDALAAGIRIYGAVLPGLLHQHDLNPRGVKVKA